jgi:hypothetical protein
LSSQQHLPIFEPLAYVPEGVVLDMERDPTNLEMLKAVMQQKREIANSEESGGNIGSADLVKDLETPSVEALDAAFAQFWNRKFSFIPFTVL